MAKIEDLIAPWKAHLAANKRDILLCMDGEAFGTNVQNDAVVHADTLEDKTIYVVNQKGEHTLFENETSPQPSPQEMELAIEGKKVNPKKK